MTLMERLVHKYGDRAVRMLDTQYRMHHHIAGWSSAHLYNNKLLAHESVAHHSLADLPGIQADDTTTHAIVFVDTAGCNMPEVQDEDEVSRSNPDEVDIVLQLIAERRACGLDASHIGVITPYNYQVELLQRRLATQHPGIEVKSVDGFQVSNMCEALVVQRLILFLLSCRVARRK